jgi:Zn/Cd-binding protein ZinT
MNGIKMFINGHSMTAKSIVITEYKDDFIRDISYFKVRVTNTRFDSKHNTDDLDKDLEHKFMSGEIVTFESTNRGRHYIFKCAFTNIKKLKKGGVSFTAMVSGLITITKT